MTRSAGGRGGSMAARFAGDVPPCGLVRSLLTVDLMSNPAPDASKQSSTNEPRPAGERRRDDARDDHGPVYHGGDWSQADAESGREALDASAEEEVRTDVERADEELDDPGTRGAVFGKGGKGIVQREIDDEPTARKT